MSDTSPKWSPRSGTWLYAAIRTLIRIVWRCFTGGRIVGREHVPSDGGILIVSNHTSIADPVVIIASVQRPLIFMAKHELFAARFAGAFLRLWGGAFPVHRGQADVGAVRRALALLRRGEAIVLFPEGTRHPEGLGPGLAGAGFIAARAQCPIVPIGITGTDRIRGLGSLRTHPAFEVQIGAPFQIASDSADPADALGVVMGRIAEQLPAERRGAYATHTGLTP